MNDIVPMDLGIDHFNWNPDKNDILSIEKVVRACYLNPDRHEPEYASDITEYTTRCDYRGFDSAVTAIATIKRDYKDAYIKFNSARMKYHDLSCLLNL